MKIEDEIKQKKFINEYQKAIINIVYTANWLNGYLDSFFKGSEITAQQYNVLRILRGQYPKPSSIKLIRERQLDRMSDTSRMIDKLVVKELVARSKSKIDKRGTDVLITEKGLELLKTLDSVDNGIMEKLNHMPEEQVVLLNNLLDKLRN